MQTVFDWLSVLLFGVLALTFLQRSVKRPTFSDPILSYIPVCIGCVLGNWLGNNGYAFLGAFVITAAAAYTFFIIRPFR